MGGESDGAEERGQLSAVRTERGQDVGWEVGLPLMCWGEGSAPSTRRGPAPAP